MDGRSQIKVHTDERTQVSSARSSLTVTHPSTNRTRRYLTSVTESPCKHWSHCRPLHAGVNWINQTNNCGSCKFRFSLLVRAAMQPPAIGRSSSKQLLTHSRLPQHVYGYLSRLSSREHSIYQRDRDSRSSSFIISGSPSSVVHSDKYIVAELCSNEFNVSTKRLGKASPSSNKIQPLLMGLHVKILIMQNR